MTRFALFSSVSLSVYAGGFKIPEDNMFISNRVAQQATVSFEDGQFSASVDGKLHQIQPRDVSGMPSTLTEEQLQEFLKHGYFTLEQTGVDEFGLSAHVRGKGGGKYNDVVWEIIMKNYGERESYNIRWDDFRALITVPELTRLVGVLEIGDAHNTACSKDSLIQTMREIISRLNYRDSGLFGELKREVDSIR